ncbi:HEPN domain-containing protein [Roseobacter litoralis]|uniref:HEPN domain-containing protein n=1 Tax=Roseobacter litoralis TaxID=42443 RepID=UPI0024934D94|nr:HEPN domain-containing protein [Roseobacter litoralis]
MTSFGFGDVAGRKAAFFLCLTLKIVNSAFYSCPFSISVSTNCVQSANQQSVFFEGVENVPEFISLESTLAPSALDLSWVQSNFENLLKMNGKDGSQRFALACELFHDWNHGQSKRKCVSTLWSCLDALYGKNERNSRRKLQERIVSHIGDIEEKNIIEAYDLRCDVVHGRRLSDQQLDKAVEITFGLVSASLKTCVETRKLPLD